MIRSSAVEHRNTTIMLLRILYYRTILNDPSINTEGCTIGVVCSLNGDSKEVRCHYPPLETLDPKDENHPCVVCVLYP